MKNKVLTILLYLMLIIFTISLIISGINIVKWAIDSKNTNNKIEEINKKIDIEEVKDNENTVIVENNEEEESYYTKYTKMNLIDVNLNKLTKINNETVGWVKLAGTNINYPYVQRNNNSYYLTHSFDKSYNKAGWVFLDYRNNKNDFDKNNIIYAHGRNDRTMFGSLRDVLYKAWLNNKDNHFVYTSTKNSNALWRVFSVYKLPTTNDYIQVEFSDDNEYTYFLNKIKNRSVYDFSTNINANDKIITLSTCYNSSEKLVLHAKLIKYEKKDIN